jgi:hypothetical protein
MVEGKECHRRPTRSRQTSERPITTTTTTGSPLRRMASTKFTPLNHFQSPCEFQATLTAATTALLLHCIIPQKASPLPRLNRYSHPARYRIPILINNSCCRLEIKTAFEITTSVHPHTTDWLQAHTAYHMSSSQ